MKLMYKLTGLLVLMAMLVAMASAGTTTKMMPTTVFTEPKYYSENGALHLNGTSLFYGVPDESGQDFGFENRTLVGIVKSVFIQPDKVTYERVNGQTVARGGTPKALEQFSSAYAHNDMDEVLVTSDNVSVYVAKESSTYYESMMIPSPDGQYAEGFGITWLMNEHEIGYAFVLPQYVDYVLDQFTVIPDNQSPDNFLG